MQDADENNTDDIRFVRNEAPKKLTSETLSETLNEQNYDPIRFVRYEAPTKLTFETLSETLNEQNYHPVVPQKKNL